MSKDYLSEILNTNHDLLQDLNNSQYIQNEFLGMLKSIEAVIPEDSRENFYRNLKTLRLNISDTTQILGNVAGLYSGRTNEICINKNMLEKLSMSNKSLDVEELKDVILMTIYHELLHMASTTRDEKTNYYASGFQHIERSEDGEFLYSEEFQGMTEGFTEKLTILAFGKRTFESTSEYGRQMNFVEHLSELTELEIMKRAYFNNRDGMNPIEKGLEEIDGSTSHIDLYQAIERDYRSSDSREVNDAYEDTLLANIEQQFLHLSSEKMKMLLEKNPTMTNEEISDFWKRIAGTINFPEKLELMGENPKKYKGIEQLRAMFMSLRQTTMGNRKKSIQIAEIEDATRDIKVSDINNETNNIRTEIQDDKDYNRGD